MVRTVFELEKMNDFLLSVFDVIPGLPRNPAVRGSGRRGTGLTDKLLDA